MQVNISFNLPKEQDDFENAINGTRYISAIYQAHAELRSILKHETGIPAKVFERLEVVKSDLGEFL
jgi:hypothetical protein